MDKTTEVSYHPERFSSDFCDFFAHTEQWIDERTVTPVQKQSGTSRKKSIPQWQ